jgi:phosphate uptake regulator
METRKIIQFGNSSYVITLPQDWLKENNLLKGKTLNLAQNNNYLILSVPSEKEERIAEINLQNKPLKIFNRELISYYLKNFKYIKIKCENCIEKLEEIRVLKEKLSSVEIVEVNKDYILLKDLSSPDELKLEKLMDEIIQMEKILFEELIKNVNNEKSFLIKKLDSNINRLTFLAFKAINYNLDVWKDPSQVKDTIHYWRIVSSFEAIGDIIKRISRYTKDVDDDKLTYVNETIGNVYSYFNFITSLLTKDVNLDNNLKLYLDKKQSLLMEFETLREKLNENLNIYLVITQLLKDILGLLDTVLISIIDLKHK